MPFQNPGPEDIKALLGRVKTIAVVGLSPKADRPSYGVSQAMQRFGYRIVPVRPATDQVLGEKAYARLADIPFPVDLVDVFREAAALPGIVDECLAINAPAIWVQEGIVHEEAAEKAREAGLCVVMDRCIFKDYVALMG
jgi:predicted CoA-binding protein